MKFFKISLLHIKSMIKKEFVQLKRDPKLRAIMIGPPIIMTLLFGYAVNTDVDKIYFAVCDRDKTTMSRDLISKFTGSNYFKMYKYVYSSKNAVKLIEQGEVDLYIEIEPDFEKKIKSGNITAIQTILDGTDSNRASVIQSYVNIITANYAKNKYAQFIKIKTKKFNNNLIKSFGINLQSRFWFNQNLKSTNFYLPGIIAMLISLITIMLTSMSIVKEKENGTLDQIKVSPLESSHFIIGKLLPFLIIAIIDIVIVTLIAIFWFKIPFKGNFLFLLFSGIIYTISTLAIGLFISTVSQTQQEAMLSSFMFLIPSILFSGVIFPIYSMPYEIQLITYLNPMRYFVEIVRGIFLKGIGIKYLWMNLIILTIMGISILKISIIQFEKR